MIDESHVFLTGRLTADPELKYLQNGTAVVNFCVAVNDPVKRDAAKDAERKCSFIDCVAWAKTAEILCTHGKKGHGVVCRGNLKQERWKSREGENRSKVIVNCSTVIHIPTHKKDDADATSGGPKTVNQKDVPF